jgi:hypothetical protein
MVQVQQHIVSADFLDVCLNCPIERFHMAS